MREKKDYYVGVGPNFVSPIYTRRSRNVMYYPRYSKGQILLAFLFAFSAITFFFWFCNTYLRVDPMPITDLGYIGYFIL